MRKIFCFFALMLCLTVTAEAAKLTYSPQLGVISYGSKSYKMVNIPGGTLSASGDDPAKVDVEAFSLGVTEVPQWLWEAVMGKNPSSAKGENNPVENVTYSDIQNFLRKLNKTLGTSLRLPTEIEWEYAACGREGKAPSEASLGEYCWYKANSSGRVHPVSSKRPGSFGVYDMQGNVAEMTFTDYDNGYPGQLCLKGGDYSSEALETAPARREPISEKSKSASAGFRLASGGDNSAKSGKSGKKDSDDLVPPTDSIDLPAENILRYDPATLTISLGSRKYTFVEVAGGTFNMGATNLYFASAWDDETPVHPVTLTDFKMGTTEVPQWLWAAVMGYNPSFHVDLDCPVEEVSWNDCQEFIHRLNYLTGAKFALPSEAQWEYAARGGSCEVSETLYSGSDNPDEVAWTERNSGSESHRVGMLAPNALGLYDMSGNVWEWCQDWYSPYVASKKPVVDPHGKLFGTQRVRRGGSFYMDERTSRVTTRHSMKLTDSSPYHGLRLIVE